MPTVGVLLVGEEVDVLWAVLGKSSDDDGALKMDEASLFLLQMAQPTEHPVV